MFQAQTATPSESADNKSALKAKLKKNLLDKIGEKMQQVTINKRLV